MLICGTLNRVQMLALIGGMIDEYVVDTEVKSWLDLGKVRVGDMPYMCTHEFTQRPLPDCIQYLQSLLDNHSNVDEINYKENDFIFISDSDRRDAEFTDLVEVCARYGISYIHTSACYSYFPRDDLLFYEASMIKKNHLWVPEPYYAHSFVTNEDGIRLVPIYDTEECIKFFDEDIPLSERMQLLRQIKQDMPKLRKLFPPQRPALRFIE